MKFLFALLALVGTGLVLAPSVTRSVRARVDRVDHSLSQVGDRLVQALKELGGELIDRLPADPAAPLSVPVTNFRQETVSPACGILYPDDSVPPPDLRFYPQWRTFRPLLPPAGRFGRGHR